MSDQMKRIVLARALTGPLPTADNFPPRKGPLCTTYSLPTAKWLGRIQYMSLDPYMRGSMD